MVNTREKATELLKTHLIQLYKLYIEEHRYYGKLDVVSHLAEIDAHPELINTLAIVKAMIDGSTLRLIKGRYSERKRLEQDYIDKYSDDPDHIKRFLDAHPRRQNIADALTEDRKLVFRVPYGPRKAGNSPTSSSSDNESHNSSGDESLSD
jgi:hypothetical protein